MLYDNFINKLPDYTKDNSIDYRIIEVCQNAEKDYLLTKSLTKKPFLNFNNNDDNNFNNNNFNNNNIINSYNYNSNLLQSNQNVENFQNINNLNKNSFNSNLNLSYNNNNNELNDLKTDNFHITSNFFSKIFVTSVKITFGIVRKNSTNVVERKNV